MSTKIKKNESRRATSDLIKLKKITENFFAGLGGKLMDTKCVKTPTYASHNLKIYCVNYYIAFSNANLFGKGSFAEEIYPRYRKMRSDWRQELKKSGVEMTNFALGFVPLLASEDKTRANNFKYKKELIKPLGTEIIKINNNSPVYYQEMAKRFKVKFALKEANGFFIGPERGMMYVLEAINSARHKINCFIDIGAGTGELSAYVLRNCHPQKVIVNEISPKLKPHLKNYLGEINKNNSVKITFDFKSCEEISIPIKTDLISVGVFYGFQPSLLRNKISEITKSLGRDGVLLIQSAMPETLFSQHILLGDLNGVNNWPWYSKKFILTNYFSRVESFFIDNQFIILASQSSDLINKIMKKIDKKTIPYNNFLI